MGTQVESNKNNSFYADYSWVALTNSAALTPPADASNSLFVIWVNNADFVYFINNYDPFDNGNLATWTNAINLSITNHYRTITNLYAKGARTFVMPNAADISKIPYVGNPPSDKAFMRARCQEFNSKFAAILNAARTNFPDISIYSLDTFALLDDIFLRPSYYGLTNPIASGGYTIEALSPESGVSDYSLNGPGAVFVFWDYQDPTAKVQEIIADATIKLMAPPVITNFARLNGSNRLDLASLPIHLDGFVDGSVNLTNWTSVTNIVSSTNTGTVFVPPGNSPEQYYRLRFPYAWTWP